MERRNRLAISLKLSVAERGYGYVEREGLALVFAVKNFHQFIYGLKFLIPVEVKGHNNKTCLIVV